MQPLSAQRIEKFEDGVLARLKDKIPIAESAFNPAPDFDTPEINAPEVEFSVIYRGGEKGKSIAKGQIIQLWTMNFEISVRTQNRRFAGSNRGAYDYLEAAQEVLCGYLVSDDYEPITLGKDAYIPNTKGIWDYAFIATTRTVIMGAPEVPEDWEGGILRKIGFHDKYGNEEEVTDDTYTGEGEFDDMDPIVPEE